MMVMMIIMMMVTMMVNVCDDDCYLVMIFDHEFMSRFGPAKMAHAKRKMAQKYKKTRSLGARWDPTSSRRPFGPAFCPSGILDFVLRALRALRPCDPRTDAGVGNIRKSEILLGAL